MPSEPNSRIMWLSKLLTCLWHSSVQGWEIFFRATDTAAGAHCMQIALAKKDPELWLPSKFASILSRFLLLEDADTGDILMPLSRLKELLGDNYSRCLNTADSRFVNKHKEADFGVYDSAPHIYWRWPFESPAHVKTAIRQELRDQSTVQSTHILDCLNSHYTPRYLQSGIC